MKKPFKLSILIPAKNDADALAVFLPNLTAFLSLKQMNAEILVLNDTAESVDSKLNDIVEHLKPSPNIGVLVVSNPPTNWGFGKALQKGFELYTGDAAVIMMADGSDPLENLYSYYELLASGKDAVLGSRFIAGGGTSGYPKFKFFLNRVFNIFLKILFLSEYNDFTNAFKGYSRILIEKMKPLTSHSFEITIELSLKAIQKTSDYAIIPIHWTSENKRPSALNIKKLAPIYLGRAIRLRFWKI